MGSIDLRILSVSVAYICVSLRDELTKLRVDLSLCRLGGFSSVNTDVKYLLRALHLSAVVICVLPW